jgi:hypothetical protein
LLLTVMFKICPDRPQLACRPFWHYSDNCVPAAANISAVIFSTSRLHYFRLSSSYGAGRHVNAIPQRN